MKFPPFPHAFALAGLTRALIELGRPDEAEGFLDEHGPALIGTPRARIMMHAARARRRTRRGDVDGALHDLLEAGRLLGTLRIVNPAILPWRAQAAELQANLGDLARARELADEELALASEWGAPRAIGIALRASGKAEGGTHGVQLLGTSLRCASAGTRRRDTSRAALMCIAVGNTSLDDCEALTWSFGWTARPSSREASAAMTSFTFMLLEVPEPVWNHDLVLKGGRVLDPASRVDRITSVAFANGKVAAIGDNVGAAKETRDVAGLIVAPGLIDLHTHVYWGGTSLGIDADEFCRSNGVTTSVDTGSAGPGNFAGFRKHVIEPAHCRILAVLSISFAGIYGFSQRVMVGESQDMRLMAPEDCAAVAEANRDVIVGIKVRIGRNAGGASGIAPLEIALQTADESACR